MALAAWLAQGRTGMWRVLVPKRVAEEIFGTRIPAAHGRRCEAFPLGDLREGEALPAHKSDDFSQLER